MIPNDRQLDQWRLEGIKVRILRDPSQEKDIVGIVVAWNKEQVLIRKPNRAVIKVNRQYKMRPIGQQLLL